MTIKSFERPIIELCHSLVHKKAQFIDNEYKLDIAELNAADKLELVSQFMSLNANLDKHLQEYLNDACVDRMYAESQPWGQWDEQ